MTLVGKTYFAIGQRIHGKFMVIGEPLEGEAAYTQCVATCKALCTKGRPLYVVTLTVVGEHELPVSSGSYAQVVKDHLADKHETQGAGEIQPHDKCSK